MRACGCCVWLRERGMVGDSTCRVLAKMPSLEKKEQNRKSMSEY